MIGGVTLANVRRGIVQAGTIGYWVGQPHAHRGYMTSRCACYCRRYSGTQSSSRRGRLHSLQCALDPGLEKCA